MQHTPPKKHDFFDNDSFDDILKPQSAKLSPWNADSYRPNSNANGSPSNSYIDNNYNQITHQQNKGMSNGQSEANNLFPFSRSATQKSGQVSKFY